MDYTQIVFDYINQFSYLAIFIFAFLSGYVIPIPEEIVLIVIGYLASQGLINLPITVIVTIISLIASDNLFYRLCRTENHWVDKISHRVFSLPLMRHRGKMEKHIDKTIFVTRFTPFLRFVGPVLASSIKTPFKDFFVFNSLAVAVYAPLLILIGFVFSSHMAGLIAGMEKFRHILVIIFWVVIGIAITHYLNKKLNSFTENTLVSADSVSVNDSSDDDSLKKLP